MLNCLIRILSYTLPTSRCGRKRKSVLFRGEIILEKSFLFSAGFQ